MRNFLLFIFIIFLTSTCFGQSGLRDSLERLDRNRDGQIEPDEITSLARPYMERIAAARRLSLDRTHRIDEYQEAARVYHALKNGVSGRGIEYEGESTIRGFEPDDETPIVPEFGLPEVKYEIRQADIEEADRTLRRYDRNDDDYIDREEAARSRWTHRDPFEMDIDKDDRLSRQELIQRYARRRMLSGASDELVRKAVRTGGSGVRSSDRSDSERRDDSQYWRRGGTRYYLTASVLGRFDRNRNGRLEPQEAQDLGVPISQLDIDRDGELSRDELQEYLLAQQDEAGDISVGLPGWFYELDEDKDGQLAMPEFIQRWDEAEWDEEKFFEFGTLDANEDGLLTADEVAQSRAMVGGSFTNERAEVLPPRKTIISEIEVDEDFVIGDVNLQLSLTHTHTSYLDGYLTGPDGQRIELFTDVGGSGDHFDQTIFDDQSSYPITKARPPYKGTFLPEGTSKRQPGLSSFNGHSARGVWQLVIRGTRSDRFGMLHGWGLKFRPEIGMVGESQAPLDDGPQSTQPAQVERRAPQSDSNQQQASRPSPASEYVREKAGQRDNGRLQQFARSIEHLPEDVQRMKIEAREKQSAKVREWMEKQKAQGKELTKEDWDKLKARYSKGKK